MKLSSRQLENRFIQFGVIIFWVLFWLLSVIDKFAMKATFLWNGSDVIGEFNDLFSSIGITSPAVPWVFLIFFTILEIAAFILISFALLRWLSRNYKSARTFFFWGTFTGLIIFSIFIIGDRMFGEGDELLEHTIYWMALIVSWGAYRYCSETSES